MSDHRKIFGAGYHAGLAARHEGRYPTADKVMLCWTPNSDRVRLVDWPDVGRKCERYEMTSFACNLEVRAMTFEQRKTMVFIEALHLIVRDGCDVSAVHRALLGLAEYRAGLAPDVPGQCKP